MAVINASFSFVIVVLCRLPSVAEVLPSDLFGGLCRESADKTPAGFSICRRLLPLAELEEFASNVTSPSIVFVAFFPHRSHSTYTVDDGFIFYENDPSHGQSLSVCMY